MSGFMTDVRRAGVDWCRLRAEIDAAMMARDDSYSPPPSTEWPECVAAAKQAIPAGSARDIHEYAARLNFHLPPCTSKPPMAPQEWAECRAEQALYFYRLGGSARGLDRFIDRAHEDYYDQDPTQQAKISPTVMAELVRVAFERSKHTAACLDEPSLSLYHSTPTVLFSDEKNDRRQRDDKSNAAFGLLKSTRPDLNGRPLTDAWLHLMKTPQSEWPAMPFTAVATLGFYRASHDDVRISAQSIPGQPIPKDMEPEEPKPTEKEST